MQPTTGRVLITGARAPVALDLARKFSRAGAVVFAADSMVPNLCQTSRAVHQSFKLPKPRLEGLEFAHKLDTLVQDHRVDLVIPTCEEVFYVAHAASLSARPERYLVSPLQTLKLLHNKHLFGQLAAGLGFDVPETRLLEHPQDLTQLPKHQKLVLKPVYSRFAARTVVLQAGHKVPPLSLTQPWLAQEFIEGQELCSYSIARSGSTQAHVTYRPIWRAGPGASVCFESLEDAQTLAFAQAVVAKLNFTGQIAFDFIRSTEGELYVLECNPRATSGVHLFGDDVVRAFIKSSSPIQPQSGRKAALRLPMLTHALGSAVRQGNLLKWWQDFQAAKDVVADWQDPHPLWHQLVCFAGFLREARKLYIRPLEATTVDIEWNGEDLPTSGQAVEEKPCISAPDQLDQIVWSDTADGQYAKNVLPQLTKTPSNHLIQNAQTALQVLSHGDLTLPLTISQSGLNNTFVCSPFNQYVTYAREELRELKRPALERVLDSVMAGLGHWLRFTQIDDVVLLNNWLLTTNLYPALSLKSIRAITTELQERFTDKAIAWRSVHDYADAPLVRNFVACGYRLIPSRSVLFYNAPRGDHHHRRDFKQDVRILEQSGYKLRGLESPGTAELERIRELYWLLYIEKYSHNNPQYTPGFFEFAARQGLLEFFALEKAGRIDAVMGLYCRGGMMAAPVFGYDTRLPQELGLYRMLSACLTLEAERRSLILHASSGVAKFKRSRGATPLVEWTAVYDQHLPLRRRLGWSSLRFLYGDIAMPILSRMEL